jgi:leader peptidase (prepilin peptidase) / N-methyltransferase
MIDGILALGLAGLLGLVVGSFLNVVIHRLPLMLQAQWDAETTTTSPHAAAFNLAVPRSHCPDCHHPLRWQDNIPLLSFMALRGRCAHCQAPIAWRYPAIELITAGLFTGVMAQHGWGFEAMAWAGFSAALVTLAAIDANTRLLPDAITQPLVWAGLLAASLGLSGIGLSEALWGAAVGYLFLWAVFWLFKGLTGKEGMGQGDFKLLAALGAWLGWPALLSLVLIASLMGIVAGLVLKWRGLLSENGEMAFGPYLVLAGLWVMAFGPLPWFLI